MKKALGTLALMIVSAGALVMPAAAATRNYREPGRQIHAVAAHQRHHTARRVRRNKVVVKAHLRG